jgi:hypothetical protein
LGQGVEDGSGGRGGLGGSGRVPGGDVPSAERGHGADGDQRLPEGQLRDDGRPAPGGDQGQDGGELHADIPGRDGDGGFGGEPLQGVVARGAGRPGDPRPSGEVPEAARCDLPVGIE